MQKWRYLIPAFLALLFVLITCYSAYYYIFLVLLAANMLNWYWGEFDHRELKETLRFFYSSRQASALKSVNAVVLLAFVVWAVCYADHHITGTGHLIGFSFAVGIFTGCFIVTLGHDLLHSGQRFQQVLSALLFTVAGIPHFASEHLCGHHRDVGLKSDPTTAGLNEVFYTYFIKITFSNIKNIYFTQYNLPGYLRRKILYFNIGMLLLLWSVWLLIWFTAAHPAQTLFFFIAQGFTAYLLYELINYIQHYGLMRSGRNEAITQGLAWNCYYKYTNYILFLLPLHSLHHLTTHKCKTSELKNGPRMPYLYFLMILMALIPPLWFRKMNKLAIHYNTAAK